MKYSTFIFKQLKALLYFWPLIYASKEQDKLIKRNKTKDYINFYLILYEQLTKCFSLITFRYLSLYSFFFTLL